MTKQELLKIEHAAIAEEVTGKFVHIHMEKGFHLTPYKEGDDIETFYSTTCMYTPIADEYQDYRVIDSVENERLTKLRQEAEKAKYEAEKNIER